MLITCTICSDLFTGHDSESICCTPCGHSFHYICLMNWFERVQSCPQCRQKANEKNIVKLYFSLGTSGGADEETAEYLKNKVDNLSYHIRLKDLDIKDLKEKNEDFKDKNEKLRIHVKNVEDKVRRNETIVQDQVKSLTDQVKVLKSQCKELSMKKSEAEYYMEKYESLKNVEKLLQGSLEEGEEILKNNKFNYDHLVRSLKLFKRETEGMKKKIQALKEDRASREKKIITLESKLSALTRDFRNTSAAKVRLEEELDQAEKDIKKWKDKCLEQQKINESLMGYSKTKSNLMKRQILEEPAPVSLAGRNLLDTDSPLNVTVYDITTPSPINMPKVRSFMSRKYDQVPSTSSSQKSTSSNSSAASSASSSTSSSNVLSESSSNRGIIRKNRFTSDPWTNLGIIKQCTARPDEVYDGLGGHSKIDVFPQPRLNTLNKKKKVSNFKLNSKKQKMDGDLPKISSFLKAHDLNVDSDEEMY